MSKQTKFILAAGGTGGHVFPALALAHELRARGHQVAIMTDKRGSKFAKQASGFMFYETASASIFGGGLAAYLIAPIKISFGILQAFLKFIVNRPNAVIGFGGYPCFAPVFAAKLLFIPIAVHEQNAILGRANKLLAKLGAHIATSYTGTKYVSEKMHARLTITGNPVRAVVREIAKQPYQPPVAHGAFHLLICGGSQGAHVFSVILPKAIARLSQEKRARLKLVQQCPVPDLKDNLRFYNALGVNVELRDFFDDMPQRIAGAHLIIGRSGASTVCEIAAIGRPAIFVPLPSALDQDQMMNAMQLSTIQAAYLIPQRILTAEKIHELLDELMDNPQKLAHMAELARSCGELEATDKLADFAQTRANARAQPPLAKKDMPQKEEAL